MATLTRVEPTRDGLTLRDAMLQMFEDPFFTGPTMRPGLLTPALDLSETPDGYHIEMAVPGIKAEDFNITFEHGVLTISGELHEDSQRKERQYHISERRYGRFSRSIRLPNTIRPDSITAELNAGVLRLSVPKAEEMKPRKIAVNG
jgi:HSP20 family protein